jgi:hypothetical protein
MPSYVEALGCLLVTVDVNGLVTPLQDIKKKNQRTPPRAKASQ